MKRQLVGLIVLLVVFVGMLTTILVNSKYIFRSEPFYSETEVEKMCDDAYMQSIKDNSDQALYDKMSELTIKNLELVNKNEELLLDKENLLSTITKNNETIFSLNATISSLQEDNSKNEQEIEDLILEVEALEKENKLLVYEVSQKNLLIEENNKTILQLQNSISYYQEFISGLETDYEVIAIFIVENEVFNIQKLNKNGLAYLETEPTVSENCVFNGWKVNGETIDLSTYQLTCNTTFVADLTYSYAVNFIVDDAVYNTQTLNSNDTLYLPNPPIKEDYKFMGWSFDGVNVIEDLSSVFIDKDINFVAVFCLKGFSETSFIGLDNLSNNFSAEHVWSCGDNTFYSNGADQLIFDKNTKTWSEYSWNLDFEIDGSNIWYSGSDVFYSSASSTSSVVTSYQYKFDFNNQIWVQINWVNAPSMVNSMYFWSDGEFTFYCSSSTKQYIVDLNTFTFTPVDLGSKFINGNFFNIGEDIYYCRSSMYCYLLDKDTMNWNKVSTVIDSAEYVWYYENSVFYSDNSIQYFWNFDTSSWEVMSWNVDFDVVGTRIWSDGENYYYSIGTTHYQIIV